MKEYIFDAVIKASEIGKGGTYVEFPYDVQAEFGVRGRVPVMCYFQDIEYRGSLVKMGGDCHIIGIRKEIRTKLGKEINDTVHVRLIKDESERKVELHPLLKAELEKAEKLKPRYEKLSYTRKKEINNLLAEARKEETAMRRLDKIIGELEG